MSPSTPTNEFRTSSKNCLMFRKEILDRRVDICHLYGFHMMELCKNDFPDKILISFCQKVRKEARILSKKLPTTTKIEKVDQVAITGLGFDAVRSCSTLIIVA